MAIEGMLGGRGTGTFSRTGWYGVNMAGKSRAALRKGISPGTPDVKKCWIK